MTGKRKINRINVLQKRSGNWCENEEETCLEIIDYFKQIFTSEKLDDFAKILQRVPRTILAEINRKLTRKSQIKKLVM